MAFLSTLNISGSALTAEALRLSTIAQNIANQNTTRTDKGEPYRRKQLVFQERPLDFKSQLNFAQGRLKGGGVLVAEVVDSQADFRLDYNPDHPDANEDGYVLLPNVDRTEETLDSMAASSAYEANLTMFSLIKEIALKTLELGK